MSISQRQRTQLHMHSQLEKSNAYLAHPRLTPQTHTLPLKAVQVLDQEFLSLQCSDPSHQTLHSAGSGHLILTMPLTSVENLHSVNSGHLFLQRRLSQGRIWHLFPEHFSFLTRGSFG